MKITYDPAVDALSIVFSETTVTTQRLADGISAEYDRDGKLAGIEILDAMKQFGNLAALDRVELVGVGATRSAG